VTSADVGGAEVRDKAHGWWTKRGQGYLCEGMDESIKMVAETLRQHGPIDGVIGFSQGAAFAAMVASLLENGRADAFAKVQGGMLFPESITELQHPPLKFGVCYSGLPMGHESYAGFYEPKIQTPLLHVMGSMDTIVEESQSLALAQRCEGGGEGLILRHAGNHAVPIGDRDISAVIQFIRDTFSPKNSSLKKEEDVLDMDMPF
jgi:predicted esterase